MKYAETSYGGKCPSITQLKSEIKKHTKDGAQHITLTWGENQIRLEKLASWIGPNGPWTGDGWIRRNGGQDIANAMNEELKK